MPSDVIYLKVQHSLCRRDIMFTNVNMTHDDKAQIKLNFIYIPALSTHMRHRDQKLRMYRKMIAKT